MLITVYPEHVQRLFRYRQTQQSLVHNDPYFDDINAGLAWADTHEALYWATLDRGGVAEGVAPFSIHNALCEVLLKCGLNYDNISQGNCEIDFIGIAHDDPSKLSYMVLDKWAEGVDPYDHTKRVMAKPGKVLRKILLDLSDHDVECVVNKIKAAGAPMKFAVVEGEDIVKYYDEGAYNYDVNLGSLGSSCMRYSKCRSYIRMYADNQNVVKMLITLLDGKVVGRALLWYVEDHVYMDRVYGSDSTIAAFLDYAHGKGWYRKAAQSYSEPTLWVKDGVQEERIFSITLDWDDYNNVPYMDTFKYVKSTDNGFELSNGSYNNIAECTCTDGVVEGLSADLVTCADTGNRMCVDDAYWVERYGDYYEEACYSRYSNEYIPDDQAVHSDALDDYLWNDKVVVTYDGSIYPEDYDDVYYIGRMREYYHVNDLVYSEVLDEDIPEHAAVKCVDIDDYIYKEDAYLVDGEYYYEEPVNEDDDV